MKKYEQIPHTADYAARIYGRTIKELFENSAYAMFDMMADLKGVIPRESVKVTAQAPDTESLLIAWLNELLYKMFSKQILFTEFNIVRFENNKLTAEAKGEKIEKLSNRVHTEIKAATYHDIRIKKTRSGYEVTIVFDV